MYDLERVGLRMTDLAPKADGGQGGEGGAQQQQQDGEGALKTSTTLSLASSSTDIAQQVRETLALLRQKGLGPFTDARELVRQWATDSDSSESLYSELAPVGDGLDFTSVGSERFGALRRATETQPQSVPQYYLKGLASVSRGPAAQTYGTAGPMGGEK